MAENKSGRKGERLKEEEKNKIHLIAIIVFSKFSYNYIAYGESNRNFQNK